MRHEKQGFVTTRDETRIFYGIRGKGPAIILSDGLACNGFAWAYLQPELAKHFSVIHWHYRGHGRSGPPQADGISVQQLARDMHEILDQLDIEQATLAGHSMGTQVCFEFYRANPERVTSLVLICGSYGKITQTFHGTTVLEDKLPVIHQAVNEHPTLTRALWGRIPATLAFQVARLVREVDALAIREEDFRNYWEHVGLMDPETFLAVLQAAGEHTAEDILPSVHVPTLIIAAEKDTFTPPEVAKVMHELIPGSEFHLVENASHALPVEQPKQLLSWIVDFAKKTVS